MCFFEHPHKLIQVNDPKGNPTLDLIDLPIEYNKDTYSNELKYLIHWMIEKGQYQRKLLVVSSYEAILL